MVQHQFVLVFDKVAIEVLESRRKVWKVVASFTGAAVGTAFKSLVGDWFTLDMEQRCVTRSGKNANRNEFREKRLEKEILVYLSK